MPTYEYACTACADRIEVVQKFTDPALTDCPACGGALRKVFSAVGVVFKGSGFYKTDSRSNAAAKSSDAPASSSSGSPDSSSSSSSSDSSAAPAAAPAKPASTAPASTPTAAAS